MRRFIYVQICGEAEKVEGAKYAAALVLYNGYRLGRLTPQEADVWKMDTPLYGHLPDTQQTTAGGRASLSGLAGRANPSHKRGLSPYLPQLPTSSSIFFTSSEHFPDYGSPPLDPPHEFSSHVSPLKVVRKFEQSKQVGVGLMRLGRRMFSAF